MHPRNRSLDGPRTFLVLFTAASALFACTESKSVGLLTARDRARPLTPGTRAQLEQNGASCSPNPTGPVLCTWSGGGATCQLTFDSAGSLTHLSCTVDGLEWECTRPGDLYLCRWSDDPSCGDVYRLDGSFEAYLCDPELAARLGGAGDAGVPAADAGSTTADDASIGPADATVVLEDAGPHDAGPFSCAGLDEAACTAAGAACQAQHCPGPCIGTEVFVGCVEPGTPPPPCLPPIDCSQCEGLDQTACEAAPGCHGVYVDDGNCGCAPSGCCTRFERCAAGPADCAGLDLSCRSVEPHCEPPYVVSYDGTCYEGCALADRCDPEPVACTATPPTFPAFDASCTSNADCAVGVRQQNCCGTDVAVGVHPADLVHFQTAAGRCEIQYPLCDCVDQGVETASGGFAPDAAHVGVECRSGVCTTFVIP